jgi:hypothetical protein
VQHPIDLGSVFAEYYDMSRTAYIGWQMDPAGWDSQRACDGRSARNALKPSAVMRQDADNSAIKRLASRLPLGASQLLAR